MDNSDEMDLQMFRHLFHDMESRNYAILNSLDLEVVVIDKHGVISEANAAWYRFAKENGDPSLDKIGVGVNYLEEVKRYQKEEPSASVVLEGIQCVIDKTLPIFIHEYIFDEKQFNRRFVMRVVPLNTESGGAVISHEEVTHLHLVELERARVLNDIEIVLDSSTAGYILIGSNGRIRIINMIASIYLNAIHNRQPNVGDNIFDFVLPEEQKIFENYFNKAIDRRTQLWERTVFINGYEFNFNNLFSPIHNDEGRVIGVCISIQDNTQIHQAQKLLLATIEHEHNLFEMQSRFVSMTSHEFRTPLTGILSSAELIKLYKDRMTPDKLTQHLDKIINQVKFMNKLIDEILLMGKTQANSLKFQPEHSRLSDVCTEILDEFKQNSNEFERIQYHCSPVFQSRLYDSHLLRLILTNLLGNALKYSPKESPVLFEVTSLEDKAVLVIKDYGIGIPEKDQKHMFEPFYRGSNTQSTLGTGLGLVVTKQAVTLHGGTIEIESKDGEGTKFIVTLPHHQQF
jgi:signal transduction histidine kinase